MIRPVPDESCMIQNKIGEVFQCSFAGFNWPMMLMTALLFYDWPLLGQYRKIFWNTYFLSFNFCFTIWHAFQYFRVWKASSAYLSVLIWIGNLFLVRLIFQFHKSYVHYSCSYFARKWNWYKYKVTRGHKATAKRKKSPLFRNCRVKIH